MRRKRLHAVATARWPVLLPALCAALWACAGPPERRPADPVPAERWRELRSEHFLLYTDLHRADARRLAGELELFRAAVLHFTNVDGSPGPVPVRIFAFRDPAHYHRFAPGGVAGFVRAGLRHVDVALSASSPEAYRIILYHEAVHLLMRGQPRRILPKWYEEGLADFLSTLVQVDDRVVVGSVSPLRAGWLVHAPPLPLPRLLASEGFAELSEDGMQRFYAWAWLLAHYVSMDHDYAEGDSALAALERYVAALDHGQDEVAAFEQGWGLDAEALDRRLEALLARGVGRAALPLARLRFDPSVALRRLPLAEADRLLGELALGLGRGGQARVQLERAVARASEDARALSGLAHAHGLAEEWERADALSQRALALAPDDRLTRLDRGEILLVRAEAQTEAPERAAWLEGARQHFRAVLAREPRDPEALAALGATHLLDGEDPALAIAPLERAFEIVPQDWLVQRGLVEAYAGAGRSEDAERMARRLLLAVHDRAQADALRAFLQEVEDGPAPEGGP